ncbi:MAG: T9SS type A sorting domain-containing protein [Bacteroidetes bacterium]|nr:T9SS type A sorting domain-containing protein [Bacteroidota bacterium]
MKILTLFENLRDNHIYVKARNSGLTFMLLFILLFSFSNTSQAQMKTQGRFLYNHCGEKVIIRGVEHMLYWTDTEGTRIAEISKSGANSVRLMLSVDDITGPKLKALLQKCINEKMYVSVAIWKPWLNRDFWARTEIKAVLLEYENYITIHGLGEAEYSNDDVRWQNEAKEVINKIRAAGYKAPIDILTSTFGRDPNPIFKYGQSLVDYDPLHNIILGVQMYWGKWYEGEFGMTIAAGCQKFATLNFPVQVGAATDDCDNNCGLTAWDEAYKNQLGAMWWAWTGDARNNNMSNDGTATNLTGQGQYLVNTGPYSLSKTSVKSTCIISGIGTTETDEKLNLQVYPNPAIAELFVNGNLPSNSNYEITSINGQILETGGLPGNGSISVKNLKAGLYFIKIKTGESAQVTKWIKE